MPAPPTIRPLRDEEVGRTLAERLVPVADSIRQLATSFGVRPYRVYLVWLGFSQDENQNGLVDADELQIDAAVGAGAVTLLKEIEIVPTPRVRDMSAIRRALLSTGVTEEGSVFIDRITRSLSEDALRGLLPQFRDAKNPETLRSGVSFHWEIREDRPRGLSVQPTLGGDVPTDDRAYRRKFVPTGVPHLRAVQWQITLERADGERGRNGELFEVLP
ncbi:MAG: hypothetical protein EPN91_00835 [Salinibacterium sp.]|nr:MAG: hypothetical protein EPN91_00835 [Salinibacterium sp.]